MQDVTRQAWGSRLLNSFFGILIGIILIIAGFVLIFWNEGHSFHVTRSLQQAEKLLVTVPITPINSANNLRVVYFTGLATTNEVLNDTALGLSVNAIRLRRDVQMFQWRENVETKTKKQIGGSVDSITTYSYEQVWSSSVINSRKFKAAEDHTNPAVMTISPLTQQASQVTVGDFTLPTMLVDNINNEAQLDLSKIDTSKLQFQVRNKLPITHFDSGLYIGKDVQHPDIGDVRISVYQVLPQVVSVIAQQVDNGLQAYIAPAGESVAIIMSGEIPPKQMLYTIISQNRGLTWVLRLVSLLMMMVGVALILQPIVVLGDFIPFVGSLLGFGTGVIAFVVGLFLWGIGTAIAWFVMRPLLGISTIILTCLICYLIIKLRRKKIAVENIKK